VDAAVDDRDHEVGGEVVGAAAARAPTLHGDRLARPHLVRVPGQKFIKEYRDQPMGRHGLHDWWYRCLERAGVVAKGQTSGERMHGARYAAGQRVLDHTRGNLKATQRLLGHSSIQTTADIYVDWDIDQLTDTLRDMLESEK
jgi:integrase